MHRIMQRVHFQHSPTARKLELKVDVNAAHHLRPHFHECSVSLSKRAEARRGNRYSAQHSCDAASLISVYRRDRRLEELRLVQSLVVRVVLHPVTTASGRRRPRRKRHRERGRVWSRQRAAVARRLVRPEADLGRRAAGPHVAI